MKIINAIKKGVMAARMVNETNEINEQRLKVILDAHEKSKTLELMKIGDKYYQVDNDILDVKEKTGDDKYRADNRLAHAEYKNQVDEKVSYLLSKPYSIVCEDEDYKKKFANILGDDFQYKLTRLGYESSNKGIAWLHPYISSTGELKFMVVPSEQCIPVWKDIEHTQLDCMIRRYFVDTWQGNIRKTVTEVEVWTATDVKYYRRDKDIIICSPTRNYDENGGIVNHYYVNDQWTSWGAVPFIPFKNNFKELPDIKFIKSIIDNYDQSRSKAANYVEDVTNYLIAIYGYNADEAIKFKRNIKEHGMMFFDEKDDDGAEILTPSTDINASKEHWQQLKKDITENGQSVSKDPEKLANAPSGIALKMMYSSLDLKTSIMAQEFNNGIDMLRYFVNTYMDIKHIGSSDQKIKIVFNVDMKTDETETIQNCASSRGVISDKTILANHPWVEDVITEMEELQKQNEENNPFKDKVPIKEDKNE